MKSPVAAFGKRATAKHSETAKAINPISRPCTNPVTTRLRMNAPVIGRRSLQQELPLECTLLELVDAKYREGVAVLVEIERAGCAVIVDLPASLQQRLALGKAADLLARRIRDQRDRLRDRGVAGARTGLLHGQRQHVDHVVAH